MQTFLILGILLSVGVYSAKLPDYLKKCQKGPGSSQCVVDNTLTAINFLLNNGEPKFKLQGLKPLHVSKINLQATPQLKVALTEVDFNGLDNLQFTSGSIDDNVLTLKGHTNRLEIAGKYDMNGRILILPIQGQGDCNITMVEFDLEYTTKLQVEERKGKKYFQVNNDETTTFKFENIKRVHWDFSNLFNGDKQLGPEMNRFLNENWNDVFGEVKASMEQAAAYLIFNYFVNGYLHFIPIDELFDES